MVEKKSNKNLIEEFYNTLVRTFIRQANTKAYVSKGLDVKLYEWARKSIETQIQKNPQNKEDYFKMYEVTDRFYKLVSIPEIKTAMINGEFKPQEFAIKYKEEILGNHKRKYDMSNMYREDLIGYTVDRFTGQKMRKLVYINRRT